MTTPTPEDDDRRFLDAISDSIRCDEEPEPVVTGYLVLATWLDRDGDPRFFGCSMAGQTASSSLGLVGYGEEHERELMRREIRADLNGE